LFGFPFAWRGDRRNDIAQRDRIGNHIFRQRYSKGALNARQEFGALNTSKT
jgi:hypothetical protein